MIESTLSLPHDAVGPMKQRQVLFTTQELQDNLRLLAQQVIKSTANLQSLAIVGIRTGGAHLALRLQKLIQEMAQVNVPTGIIDINLYRDDWTRIHNTPIVGKTELSFSINDRDVLLVDDVVFTGRTIRAAMDALMDFGRPKSIKLLVLVDRGGRELPICAHYVALEQEVMPGETVNVYLKENGDRDEVVVERHTD